MFSVHLVLTNNYHDYVIEIIIEKFQNFFEILYI